MKTYLYKITLLFLFAPTLFFANTTNDGFKHEKSKSVKKTYQVNKNALVTIKNKYGNIDVKTWDKNTVEIEVKITVKGNSQSKVADKLESIVIKFDGNSDFVTAKTLIEKNHSSWNIWGKNPKITYQINYTVKIPVTNHVALYNDYGNIMLDELKGNAKINCDYGKVFLGDLLGADNQISLDYSRNSTIEYMKSGKLNLDYSKLSLGKAGNLKLNSDYSTTNIDKANTIHANIDYGSLTVGDVNHLKANADYAAIKIKKLSHSLKLTCDYGSIKIGSLLNGFDFVDIRSEYAGIYIGTSKNTNFKFNIKLEYAKFKYNDDTLTINKSFEKSSSKSYEGTYGKKSNSTVKINSSYGNVILKKY